MSQRRRAKDSPKEIDLPPGFARRLSLLVAIALVFLVVGYLISQRLWTTADKAGRDAGALPSLDPATLGPAFSADATPDQIKAEVLRVADELAQALPDNADALGVTARLQFNLGKFDEAVKTWRECLKLDENAGDACYGIGYVAAQGGNHEEAAQMLQRAMVLNPADLRIPPLLADELMTLGRFEEAVKVLEPHVRGPVTSAMALTTLGKAYVQLQRYQEAKIVFEAAVQYADDKNKKAALYGLGTACARLGLEDEAKRYREEFAALDAGNMQEHTQRLKDFADAGAMRDLLARVHLDAGQQYLKHGPDEKAEEMLQKAALAAPKDVESRKALLTLYERTGRERDALAVCRKLQELEPTNGDHWLNVGMLSARLGDFDEAMTAAKKAVDLDPNNPQYRKAYEMIKKGK